MNDILDSLFNAQPTIQAEQTVSTEFKHSAQKGKGQVYTAVVRFIPNPADPSNKSIISKNTVFLENPLTHAKKEIDCPSTVGQPDPLQDTFFALRNSANPVLKENSKKFSRRQRYTSLIQVLSCESEPQLVGKILSWTYGIKIHEKIYNEMNPPMGTPRNPFNMFIGRPFFVKCKLVSGFNNFDDSQFIDLAPNDGAMRIMIKNQQGQDVWQPITQEVVTANPNVKNMVLTYLQENAPSLEPFEYHAWTPEVTEFVNTCIQLYTNPQASMAAATGMQAPTNNGFMQQPAMMPQTQPVMQPVMNPQPTGMNQNMTWNGSMPVQQPAMNPMEGLQMGASVTEMTQTTPGGFAASNIDTAAFDAISQVGTPQPAPTNPAAGMSLDDVLAGVMP